MDKNDEDKNSVSNNTMTKNDKLKLTKEANARLRVLNQLLGNLHEAIQSIVLLSPYCGSVPSSVKGYDERS